MVQLMISAQIRIHVLCDQQVLDVLIFGSLDLLVSVRVVDDSLMELEDFLVLVFFFF
jgi:hypothetical protein